jgi:hypothetical protein
VDDADERRAEAPKPKAAPDEREARLAAALRANLRRRKAPAPRRPED